MRTGNRLAATLAASAFVIGLLLGPGAAQAVVVLDPSDDSNALGILGLQVGDTLYNVSFVEASARQVYGPLPGEFDFTSADAAEAAANAVNDELNQHNLENNPDVTSVGPEGSGRAVYNIAWYGDVINPPVIEPIDVAVVWDSSSVTGDWVAAIQSDIAAYNEILIYADFTVVPVPPAVWLLGSAMVALGAVARRRRMTA